MKRHDRIVDTYVFNFKESVRGLAVGAPVDFRGIVVGEVAAIYTRFDPVTKRVQHPGRGAASIRSASRRATRVGREGRQGRERSARARGDAGRHVACARSCEPASLLTGQLYIALDFFPTAPKAKMDWDTNPPEMPTVPGGLQSLQDSVTALVAQAEQDSVRRHRQGPAQQTLQHARHAAQDARHERRARGARRRCVAARTALDAANQHAAARFRDCAEHGRHDARTVAHGGVVPRARRLSRTPSRGADPRQAGG